MSTRHCWLHLELIDGLRAHVRADQVVAIAPAEAFPDMTGPAAGGGCVVSVGNMLPRAQGTVEDVTRLVWKATA